MSTNSMSRILVVATSTVWLAACGAETVSLRSKADATNVETEGQYLVDGQLNAASALNQPLIGEWRSETCETIPSALGGFVYFTRSYAFKPKAWTLDFSTFADPGCHAKLTTVSIKGTYKVTADTPAGRHVYLGFASRTATPASAQSAEYLNKNAICGHTDWRPGITKDIHQNGCDYMQAYPAFMCAGEYDLVQINGSELRFGQRGPDGNICSPDKRPQTVAPIYVVKAESWLSGCHARYLPDGVHVVFARIELEFLRPGFSGNKLRETWRIYSGGNSCPRAIGEFTVAYTYQLGRQRGPVGAAIPVNSEIDRTIERIDVPATAAAGPGIDIKGLALYTTPGTTVHDIVKTHLNRAVKPVKERLLFGIKGYDLYRNGTTPERRPNQFDQNVVFIRQ